MRGVRVALLVDQSRRARRAGSNSGHPTVSTRPSATSPTTSRQRCFREIFLPTLERQTRFLKYVVYHLDGVGNFVHLPTILELPGVGHPGPAGGGQAQPAALPRPAREVQAAGKNLVLCLPPEEIPEALSVLSTRGLLIETSCRTEQEARDLLRAVEGLSQVKV